MKTLDCGSSTNPRKIIHVWGLRLESVTGMTDTLDPPNNWKWTRGRPRRTKQLNFGLHSAFPFQCRRMQFESGVTVLACPPLFCGAPPPVEKGVGAMGTAKRRVSLPGVSVTMSQF